MTLAAAQFVGDIPSFYDRHLGPVIFQDYAADLARRAAALGPADVLEIAAGTGVSTVALRAALPTTSRIVATDLNPPMLEIARAKIPSTANIAFQQADATALPFRDASFDLVAIQFGVMFFPDRPGAYAQAWRVLKPGGTLLFNVWASMQANPFGEIANAAGRHFLPANPPLFYLTPFGYADAAQVRADLAKAGFTDVAQDVVRFNKEVRDWRHFAQGAVYGNPMIGDLQAASVNPDDVVAHIADQLAQRFGAAPARMPLEATVYAARKR